MYMGTAQFVAHQPELLESIGSKIPLGDLEHCLQMDFLAQDFIPNSHPIGQTLGMAGLPNDLAIGAWIVTPEPFFADHYESSKD